MVVMRSSSPVTLRRPTTESQRLLPHQRMEISHGQMIRLTWLCRLNRQHQIKNPPTILVLLRPIQSPLQPRPMDSTKSYTGMAEIGVAILASEADTVAHEVGVVEHSELTEDSADRTASTVVVEHLGETIVGITEAEEENTEEEGEITEEVVGSECSGALVMAEEGGDAASTAALRGEPLMDGSHLRCKVSGPQDWGRSKEEEEQDGVRISGATLHEGLEDRGGRREE